MRATLLEAVKMDNDSIVEAISTQKASVSGDLFEEKKLAAFFNRCSLNFDKQFTLFNAG